MAATATMRAKLRRMVDEPDTDIYSDDTLDTYIETYPVMDLLGTIPQEVDYTTSPPTISENDEWIPTYDLHAAAADIWEEKASGLAEDYDATADGSTLRRSQVFDQYMKKARFHLSRRKAKTRKAWVEPRVSPDEESNSD